MKKLAILLLVVFASFTILGCENNREFKVDGEFTAYEVSVSRNAPQVTYVTVTITDGKIVDYAIDVRQGARTQNATTLAYSFAWNASTKTELGFNYKMHYATYTASLADAATATLAGYQAWLIANSKLEWFQQADLIEAAWLANGVTSVTKNTEGRIDNVAGVTVSDAGYLALAVEAVELAKAGKFQAIKCVGTDLYIATMTMNAKGEFSELKLDVLQATKDATAGTFVWHTETKQEKGFNYKMHYNTYVASLTDAGSATIAGYQAWLTANNKLEWFQQANLITDYIMANGYKGNLKPIVATGRGVSLYGKTALDGFASVSITSGSYYDVLAALFAKVAK
jgi:major membrane immunogen (membrane-anchored lipoprotein)